MIARPTAASMRRGAALAALALALLAAGAGSPTRDARIDVAALARMVEREEDHVTAVELARWIRDRRPGLRVIDVRPRADWAAYHIPTAEQAELSGLAALPVAPDDVIVLYSGGGAHAGQGWVFLRARGVSRVYWLRGGLAEWMDEVLNPSLPGDATPAERADFDAAAPLARYFGGVPRRDVPAAPRVPIGARIDSSSTRLARVRGRGC